MSPDNDVQDGAIEHDEQKGKLTLVGLGPGDVKQITPAALEALSESDVVIGYKLYLRQIKDLVDQTRVQEFPMGKEQERALEAFRLALEGMKVAVVTGGDAGVYDMAAPVFELVADMVVALYEPSSRHRPGQLGKAQEVLLKHRSSNTPVTVAREITQPSEKIGITSLEKMTELEHDKRTVIIVGNSKTKSVGDWMITPRAY